MTRSIVAYMYILYCADGLEHVGIAATAQAYPRNALQDLWALMDFAQPGLQLAAYDIK